MYEREVWTTGLLLSCCVLCHISPFSGSHIDFGGGLVINDVDSESDDAAVDVDTDDAFNTAQLAHHIQIR